MVDDSLPAGQILSQSVHAAFQFAIQHNKLTIDWFNISNYICILETNKENLLKIIEKAKELSIPNSIIIEPDLNNEITAIALAPLGISKKICSNFKLALRDVKT